jgi:cytochrome c-type biogenesis protein CcmH/NrfF
MAKLKDLSQMEHSATSIYISLLPDIESIKNESISDKEKMEKIILLVVSKLCKARNESLDENNVQISQDYIVRVRQTLSRQKNVRQIEEYINNAIEKGKNYKEPEEGEN